MAEHHQRDSKKISRRIVLTLGALTAGAIVYGQFPEDSSAPSPAPLPTPAPPKPALLDRDPAVTTTLRRTRNTSGALRKFESAFPATKIRRVEPLPGLSSSDIPWLAVTIVGPVHQLQIINPNRSAPVRIVEIPESNSGGVQSMIWDKKSKNLYLATANYLLIWKSTNPSQTVILGKVPGASTIYDLQLDSQGTIWGGTYPLGAAFRYTPQTKKIEVFERVAPDTDYVRQVAVDAKDNVWLGTGSRNPRIFRFSIKNPRKITEILLPKPKSTGFILSLEAIGNSIITTINNVSGQLILDQRNNSWVVTVERRWARQIVSDLLPKTNQFFNVSDGKLFSTNPSTWEDELVSELSANAPLSIYASPAHVVVVSSNKVGLQIEVLQLKSKSVQLVNTVALARGEFVVQSLMAHSDGNIYVGGYMGRGITAVDPDTGKHWSSPTNQNVINQIEGMIEFNADKTYVGSYGSADIVRINSRTKNSLDGYERLFRLATDYEQSRIFAWAKNSKNVFFGTVPEYGRSGGIVGAIEPNTDKISWVLDGDGQGVIAHHSITGLAANEEYLYGTTSVRNGYGLADTEGNAKVFKVEIATQKVLWTISPITKCGALYAPKLLAGWLLVADLEGVMVLNPENGKLMKKHRLTNTHNTSYRPGWKNADLVVLESQGKAVHTAAGTTTVVNFASGTQATIGSPVLRSQFGTRLTVSNTGRVFVNTEKTALAELDLKPIAAKTSSKTPSTKKPIATPSS